MKIQDVINLAKKRGPKTVSVACCQDKEVLLAVENARKEGIIEAILVGDIDKTKEGAPYVVSDDGWGWLGLAILALVPVVFMGFALQGMANFISSHPIWIIVGYILLTLGIGAISYKRKTGLWNVLGMVATSISFLPILLTEMLVEIPSIVRAGDSVGGMIELLMIVSY